MLDTKDGPYDIDTMGPQSGRRIIEDGSTVNIGNIQYDERYSVSLINGKPQGTIFGVDLVVGSEKISVAGKWNVGLIRELFESLFVGTGIIQITPGEQTIELVAGIEANSITFGFTKLRIRYEAGAPLIGVFTVAFPELADSNGDYTCGIGLIDPVDGWAFCQRRRINALEYGFQLRKNGIKSWFPLDYDYESLPLSPYDLNIIRMQGGFLGVAPTDVYLQEFEDSEVFIRLHRQIYKQKVTSVATPDLPLGMFIENEGNTLATKILNGSYRGGVIDGGQQEDPSAIISTYDRSYIATPGINNIIFSFKNDETVEMLDSFDYNEDVTTRVFKNPITSQLLEVKMAVLDNNKNVRIDVYVTSQENIISGIYTSVELGRSVLKVSEDADIDLNNPLIPARKIEQFLLLKDGQIPNSVIATLDLLSPGDVAIFVSTTTSVNFTIDAYIKYADRY